MTPQEIAGVQNITIESLVADIPLELARRAHAGTSHVPDERGDQEREHYAVVLLEDYHALAALCGDDDAKVCGVLADEFQRYREGYRARFIRRLVAHSRCLSTMITGGSNFNVRRAEKANDAEHRATQDLVEYRKRALRAIRRELDPSSGPIRTGDDDAVERLEVKLTDLVLAQEQMKEANAAIRSNRKAGEAAQIAALVDLGFTEALAREALKPDSLGRVGFPAYQLSNNNAQIARVRERIERVRAAKIAEVVKVEGVHAVVEEDPPANRVRVYFSDKPDEATRARLKSSGFRWAPSQGAWSAYHNHRSIAAAREIAGVSP
jgi:hypothetical protein